MSALRARTLVEAYLYITLSAVAVDSKGASGEEPGPSRDYDSHVVLSEARDAWILRFDGHRLGLPVQIALFVEYESEFAARRESLRFGEGTSELIDAGQWRVLSAGYARRAMRDDLLFAESPGDPQRFRGVVLGWESARDAAIEAAKFLPEGADEVPAGAFWSETGTAAQRDEPELFTREALETDIAFYRQTLDDFVLAHSGEST